MKIAVVGCGKVGYSHAQWMRKRGHTVVGVDNDHEVLTKLEVQQGLEAVSTLDEAPRDLDAIHICVPTELNSDRQCDLSIIESVIFQIRAVSWKTVPVVVQRSTCPVGTGDRLAKLVDPLPYVVNPSFLRKATIKEDNNEPERVAIGGPENGRDHLLALYSSLDSPLFLTESRRTTELLKYVENSLDSLLLSFWNEIMMYALANEINPDDLVYLIERVQDRPKFRTVSRAPGRPFGLWCLPKDLIALISDMKQKGSMSSTLEGVMATNEAMGQIGDSTTPARNLYEFHKDRLRLLPDAINSLHHLFE